jgi:hypothetical protein
MNAGLFVEEYSSSDPWRHGSVRKTFDSTAGICAMGAIESFESDSAAV